MGMGETNEDKLVMTSLSEGRKELPVNSEMDPTKIKETSQFGTSCFRE